MATNGCYLPQSPAAQRLVEHSVGSACQIRVKTKRSDCQHPCECQVGMAATVQFQHPALQWYTGHPRGSWLPRLVNSLSSGFKWEILPQKTKQRVTMEDSWQHPLASTCTHIYTPPDINHIYEYPENNSWIIRLLKKKNWEIISISWFLCFYKWI